MSDINLEISTGEVRRQCQELRSLATEFLTCSNEMFNDGRALDACWEGAASDQFATRLRADEPRFGELQRLIVQYCDDIEQSANDYDRMDQQTAQNVNTNTIRRSR